MFAVSALGTRLCSTQSGSLQVRDKQNGSFPKQQQDVYVDDDGQTQGPFSSSEMQEWYNDGHLPRNLMVKEAHWNNFHALPLVFQDDLENAFGFVPRGGAALQGGFIPVREPASNADGGHGDYAEAEYAEVVALHQRRMADWQQQQNDNGQEQVTPQVPAREETNLDGPATASSGRGPRARTAMDRRRVGTMAAAAGRPVASGGSRAMPQADTAGVGATQQSATDSFGSSMPAPKTDASSNPIVAPNPQENRAPLASSMATSPLATSAAAQAAMLATSPHVDLLMKEEQKQLAREKEQTGQPLAIETRSQQNLLRSQQKMVLRSKGFRPMVPISTKRENAGHKPTQKPGSVSRPQ